MHRAESKSLRNEIDFISITLKSLNSVDRHLKSNPLSKRTVGSNMKHENWTPNNNALHGVMVGWGYGGSGEVYHLYILTYTYIFRYKYSTMTGKLADAVHIHIV